MARILNKRWYSSLPSVNIMQPPIFKIAFFASFLCMAVYANQDPEEPQVTNTKTPIELPQMDAAVGLLDVMSDNNMSLSQDDKYPENTPTTEISMSPYVVAASKAERQFEEDSEHCHSLGVDEQYDCMTTANANYEVIKADAETLRGVAYK